MSGLSFDLADWIIFVKNDGTCEEGTPSDLLNRDSYLSKFISVVGDLPVKADSGSAADQALEGKI